MSTGQFCCIMTMLHYIAFRLSPDSIATAFMVLSIIFFALTIITGTAELGSSWRTSSWKSGAKVEPKQEPKWF